MSLNGSRQKVLQNLVKLRQEWEDAADGENLTDVQGSVGLLLYDVCLSLDLSPREVVQVLDGVELVELR